MNEVLRPLEKPELVFGLVAPIGVDLDIVVESLQAALSQTHYTSDEFRLTQFMKDVPVGLKPVTDDISVESYRQRIANANKVRKVLGNDAMAGIAVSAIRAWRERKLAELPAVSRRRRPKSAKGKPGDVLSAHAYIIRQLKRPEEVALLRRIYGRQFVLVSAYAPEEQRCTRIKERERQRASSKLSDSEIDHRARELIDQDLNEANNPNGQNVRDVFPLADVFIDASSRQAAAATTTRFVKLLFGNNWLTPSRDEYAMYIAKSASLRSSDLSRQVGAAIFSTTGEVITLGCNEVPKAMGGTYWEGDEGDARDFQLGRDTNEAQKFELLVDLVERLRDERLLSSNLNNRKDVRQVARDLIDRPHVASAKLMDIIEFGRIIHAEASALADASRRGLSVRDATLYCTTFPCHLCATNIVASGVSRVVFIEPYPKSYATVLHKDAITLDGAIGKVVFEPFVGVSPVRYRDLFERKKRKSKAGKALEWNTPDRRPLIEVYETGYALSEATVVGHFKMMIGKVAKRRRATKKAPVAKRKHRR